MGFTDAYHVAWLLEQPFNEVYAFDQKHFRRFAHLQVKMSGEVKGEQS